VSLPDAPRPAITLFRGRGVSARTVAAPQPLPSAPGAASRPAREKRKWILSVEPGESVPKLSAREKMAYWLHEEIHPASPIPAFVSAGYGQMVLNDPNFGSDSGAFGARLGAAFLRQATMRFFVSSAIPALDGEDPRYYLAGSGGIADRAGYAVKQAFFDRLDNGRSTFNFSNIFGHLAAASLTPLYYPPASRGSKVVMQTWATSIAGSAANNLFLEFLPELVHKWPRMGRFGLPGRHRGQ